MWARKISICSLFLLLIIGVVSCNNEESGVINIGVEDSQEVLQDVEIKQVDSELLMITYIDIYGTEDEYASLYYENQHYVSLNDFIEIVGDINYRNKAIIDLTEENYKRATNTLSFTLMKSNERHLFMSKSQLYSEFYEVQEYSIEGDDYIVEVDLNDEVFHSVLVDDDVYIPLQIINYKMFKDGCKLYRLSENTYENHAGGLMDDLQQNYLEVDLNGYNDDYERSFFVVSEFLETTGAISDKIKPRKIESYSSYIANLYELSNDLRDYHYSVYHDERIFDFKVLNYEDQVKILDSYMYLMFDDYLVIEPETDEDDPIKWEKLNDNTLYIDCDTFAVNDFLYKMTLKKLETELNDNGYKTIIIDLRYNGGGSGRNATKLFTLIAGDEYTYTVGQLYNNHLYSKHTYHMKRTVPNNNSYDIVLLLNEYSASASISFSNLVRDNLNTQGFGSEPKDKQSGYISKIQALDGTVLFKSQRSFVDLNFEGINYDDVKLVDNHMSNNEIKDYLDSLREEQ